MPVFSGQKDGNFGVINEINDAIKAGIDLNIDFKAPQQDVRLQSKRVLDSYNAKMDMYQKFLDASANGGSYASNPFELGQMNPFSFMDTQYVIHPREMEYIDGEVAAVMRAMAVMDRLFGRQDVGRGKTSEKFYDNKAPRDPIQSKNFKTYQPGVDAETENEVHFLGVHKDYEFGMVELDASRNGQYFNSNILERTTQDHTAMVMDFRERILLRGGDIRSNNNKNIDTRVKGLVNWSGIQVQSTYDDFTTFGVATDAVTEMIKQLQNYYFKPPYQLVVTPWVYIQLLRNRHTYSNKTEIWELLNLGQEAGQNLISGITATPHLLKVDETTSTGAMYLIAQADHKGRANALIAESYPLWHYPLSLGTQIGVAGKIAWMGSFVLRRPKAVSSTVAITTA